MPALTAAAAAPDFTLTTTDGKSFSLKEELTKGPVVLVFFKISCPVCQYALPFLQRIHRGHAGKSATIVGVSQNKQRDTVMFMKEYGISFPVLLDDTTTYPVSNAYGLTNVPTVFWIGQDGQIEISSVGWSRKDVEAVHRRMTELNHGAGVALFKAGEDVPDFRAG